LVHPLLDLVTSVGALLAGDQAVEAQATKVKGHLRGAVVPAEEFGHLPAKALVGEAGDGVDDEGTGQGHGALIPEAQCSGSLARFRVRLEE